MVWLKKFYKIYTVFSRNVNDNLITENVTLNVDNLKL